MKLITCLALFISMIDALHARKDVDFNRELLKSVDKEIKKDDESFRTRKPSRGPASVEQHEIVEEKKIDKKDRQIGHRNW